MSAEHLRPRRGCTAHEHCAERTRREGIELRPVARAWRLFKSSRA